LAGSPAVAESAPLGDALQRIGFSACIGERPAFRDGSAAALAPRMKSNEYRSGRRFRTIRAPSAKKSVARIRTAFVAASFREFNSLPMLHFHFRDQSGFDTLQ
jgi:hypothetical protein